MLKPGPLKATFWEGGHNYFICLYFPAFQNIKTSQIWYFVFKLALLQSWNLGQMYGSRISKYTKCKLTHFVLDLW